jgi:hypothetical protein
VAHDQLRPGQVAKITTTPPLPAELTDAILDSTDEELAAAIAQKADDTREWLEQIGALKPSASVLDLDHDQLQVLATVYAVIWRWWAGPGYRERPLNSILKVAPTEVSEAAMRLLCLGGFLPPESAALQE